METVLINAQVEKVFGPTTNNNGQASQKIKVKKIDGNSVFITAYNARIDFINQLHEGDFYQFEYLQGDYANFLSKVSSVEKLDDKKPTQDDNLKVWKCIWLAQSDVDLRKAEQARRALMTGPERLAEDIATWEKKREEKDYMELEGVKLWKFRSEENHSWRDENYNFYHYYDMKAEGSKLYKFKYQYN